MTITICEDRQRVLDAESHTLVTGGPGSGKTTIALKKALKQIEDGLELGQQVLFLSFSRAAVARVIESLKEHVPKEHQSKIVIQTFHSFFWQILKTYGYLLGSPRHLNILLPHDEQSRNNGISYDDEKWETWEEEREKIFHEDGLVAFDLFSPKTLEVLTKSKIICQSVADRCALIIIDEAQDTAEEQWSCIHSFAQYTQLLCMADLEQQIYDFRPGVSAERVKEIINVLDPELVDLGNQNNRSPGVEIVQFGNDILLDTPRGSGYVGISRMSFRPNASFRDMAIRQSVGIIYKKIEEQIGKKPESIAILATWGRGVIITSRALRGNNDEKEIPHHVLFDETSALLASRFIAFMLEPKKEEDILLNLGIALSLLLPIYKAKGTKTSLIKSKTLQRYSDKAIRGEEPRKTNLINALTTVLEELVNYEFSGNPKNDWMTVRKMLRKTGVEELKLVDSSVEYLMGFNRGKLISGGLSAKWQDYREYRDARKVVDDALSEEQIMSDISDLTGINVMTIHKSKGKEFDGVILFDESRNCPFVYSETSPYPRSRKLLRVGITRAKTHVLLLTDAFKPTPLLQGHTL